MRSERNATISIFLAGALLGEVVVHSLVRSGSAKSPPGAVSAAVANVDEHRIRRLEAQYRLQLDALREARRPVHAQTGPGLATVTEPPALPAVPEPVISPPQPVIAEQHSAPAAPQVEQLPPYEVLHAVGDLRGQRTYGEILLPTISQTAAAPRLGEWVKQIAKREGFDLMTIYSSREAREAHYSMEYADQHPGALAAGLLGVYEQGRFKPIRRD